MAGVQSVGATGAQKTAAPSKVQAGAGVKTAPNKEGSPKSNFAESKDENTYIITTEKGGK